MSDIKIRAAEILNRVNIAANGQVSTSNWSEADINLSAPDGMDYWDWIEQAHDDAQLACDSAGCRIKELEYLVKRSIDRLNDCILQDDGQAYKEAEKFIDIANKALEQAQ